MTRFVCQICGHAYDPGMGEPNQNILPGTPFASLPADWACPVCSAGKRLFREA